MSNKDDKLLLSHHKAIQDFENIYIKDNFDNYKEYDQHRGYLIKLESYEALKNKIQSYFREWKNASKIVKSLNDLDDIEFKTSTYLINMILNGNKYIIINTEIWELFGKKERKDKAKILYSVNKDLIIFTLDDNKKLVFSCKKHDNIIVGSSFSKDYNQYYKTLLANYENINKIYKEISDYYNFDIELENYLNHSHYNQIIKKYAYFVDINWLKIWKKKTNYDEIKKLFKQQIGKNQIMDELILLEEINKVNSVNLSKILIKNFESIEALKLHLLNNSLAIVSSYFVDNFDKNAQGFIQYSPSKNLIKIIINFKELKIQTNNNIITLKENITNNIEVANDAPTSYQILLKLLIKLYYFNNEINDEINIEYYKKPKNRENKKLVYFISKKSMNKFKDFFGYSSIFKPLLLSKELESINYNNYKEHYAFIIRIIENSNNEYIKRLKANLSLNKFKFEKNDYEVPSQISNSGPGFHQLKYFYDFEILNEDIICYFEKLGIIKKENLTKGEYLACDGKILLSINEGNNNYLQIDSFDEINQNFIINYIIEDLTTHNYALSLFKINGIDYLLNRKNDNKIKYDNEIIYCYEIKNEESNIENEFQTPYPLDNDENKDDIENIINLLFSYSLFIKDIQKRLSENKSSGVYKYYLINKQIISEFLDSFWDETIIQIIQKNILLSNSDIDDKNKFKNILKDKDLEKCKRKITEKKDLFMEKVKNIDIYKIETSSIQENNVLYYYPKDLMFLNEPLLLKFINFLGIQESIISKKNVEINLNFNFGNIAFKNDEKFFLKNRDYLIYIYSMEKNSLKNINFNIELILSFAFLTYFNNNFENLICIDIKKNCMDLSKDFESQYNLKIHLLNNNSDNIEENKLDKTLNDLIELYKENLKMEIIINSYICSSSTSSEKENKYYLIHKNYIKDFETLLFFDKIKIILNNEINPISGNNQKECLKKIKESLPKNNLKKLSEIEDNSDLEKFKNNDLYKLQKIPIDEEIPYYYDNFVIISEGIKQILSGFNSLLPLFIETVECCFDNKKFFISFEDNISVGHIEQNNEYIVDNLIVPKTSYHTKWIFQNIKKEGNFFIQKNTQNGNLCFEYEYKSHIPIDIRADIINIVTQQDSTNNSIHFQSQESRISEGLKKFILLYLEIQNNNQKYSKNNILEEEVYLINVKILSNPILKEIYSLIKDNKEILYLLNQYNFETKCLSSSQLDEIIEKISKEKLNQLDKKLIGNKINDSNPDKKEAILKNGERINIYEKFVMIREKVYNDIYSELNLFNIPKIFYTNLNGDYIIIDEKRENAFIGKIINKNYFQTKYILAFKYQNDIKSEIELIKANGIEKYLKSKTVFNNELNSDCLSPIFSKYDNIGYCYKIINENLDFRYVKNYAKYVQNSNFKKSLNLINFYKKFKEAMNSSNATENEYYLINEKAMSKIKKLYYYREIKSVLDKIEPNEINQTHPSKLLLHIIKLLPEKILKNFVEEELDIDKLDKSLMEPDIVPIYPNNINSNNEEHLGMIYKNFEIIEPEIAKQFFHGIKGESYFNFISSYDKDNNVLNCLLKDGKVIIKYENHNFNNQKNIVVIGTINNENTFINQYFLIYDRNYTSDVYDFKYRKLNNYLNEFKFFNNSCPIVIKEYEQIGTIIKLENNSNNINIDNNDDQYSNMTPYDNNYGISNPNDNKYGTDINNDINNNKNNDELNLNSKMNITSIRQYFPFRPLVGLDNIGATCYMNATLQCLCNIEKFIDYFKYNPHLIKTVKNDITRKKLCTSFKILIEKLWPDNYAQESFKSNKSFSPNFSNPYEIQGFNEKNSSFPPEDLKKKISKMNPLFEGIAANDAKDLVQFLIMTLHEELNKVRDSNINNGINNDQRNKQLMFQIFAQDFMKNNVSVISDLFYGVNYNIIQCGFCNTQSFNYQTYFFLVFPLEEVRIFKSQNNYNYNFNYNFVNNNEVNIYDCFFYEQKVNYMTGTNIMYCNYCKQNYQSSMRTIIATGPEILIIILNRGQGIQYNVKINFLEEINLANFIEMNQTGCNYKLIGVITHLGESGMGGHFIAYCKDPITNQWHKYNDSIVSEVNNFKTEVIDYAMPYLLFYQKSN